MKTKQDAVCYDRVILAIGHHTAFIAEQELTGCQACDELASVPFSFVVLELSGFNPSEATCILPRPNECPRCRARVVETTLVRPVSAVRVPLQQELRRRHAS